MKKTLISIAALFLFVTGLSFQGLAQDQMIQACYDTAKEKLRIVSGSDDCKKQEQYIYWYVEAPQAEIPRGALGYYDDNGVFLGYWAGVDTVFDPELNLFFRINIMPPPQIEGYNMVFLYYTSEDCSGQPLSNFYEEYFARGQLFDDEYNNVYRIVDLKADTINGSAINSGRRVNPGFPDFGICNPQSFSDDYTFIPAPEIAFPLANVELAFPIVVKPIE